MTSSVIIWALPIILYYLLSCIESTPFRTISMYVGRIRKTQVKPKIEFTFASFCVKIEYNKIKTMRALLVLLLLFLGHHRWLCADKRVDDIKVSKSYVILILIVYSVKWFFLRSNMCTQKTIILTLIIMFTLKYVFNYDFIKKAMIYKHNMTSCDSGGKTSQSILKKI